MAKLSVEDAVDRMSNVIIDYNLNKTYNRYDYLYTDKQVFKPICFRGNCNCQNFVDDLAKSLGIDLTKFSGQLGNFVANLRVNGASTIDFKIPPAVRQVITTNEAKVTFK
jgi:hypothetical protein